MISLHTARRLAVRRVAQTALVSLCCIAALLSCPRADAQLTTDLVVYSNGLQNGFGDWSWTTHNMSETTTVYPGCTEGIEVDFTPWAALYLAHGGMPGAQFSALTFYLNGGATGGQKFNVIALDSTGKQYTAVPITSYVPGGTVPANQWVQVTIPLTALGVASIPNLGSFWFGDSTGTNQPAMYLDQISLTGPIPPANVNVSVNAAQPLHTIDSRVFGVNTEVWDGDTDTSAAKQLMSAAGIANIRLPGGSAGDDYDWTKQQWYGQTATPQFGDLANSIGASAYVIANYGTGTVQEAAAWLAYCNASLNASSVAIGVDSTGRNWQTSQYWAQLRASSPLQTDDGMNFLRIGRTSPIGFHNWEFGNECFGAWEPDNHTVEHDPITYANTFQSAYVLMKSIDPTISLGVVATASEDDYGISTESVTNPVTGVSHSGWTAVLFSTLAGLGVVPDSISFHNYAQGGGGGESDPVLLHNALTWPSYATAIRTMLTQYFGASASAKVQFACTENNSAGSAPGKQTTSLVNGLYYADSIGSLLQTEFVCDLWWDLHNGPDTGDNNASTLYGWRQFGDYGVLASATAGLQGSTIQDTPYPTYFGMKLLSKFAHGGDSVVTATSSYINLTTYSALQANGDLALLVINKEPVLSLPATISLSGFYPSTIASATEYQYGITQDTEQSEGQTVDLAQSSLSVSGPTIQATFPPYSMSVIVLTPQTAPPSPTISPNGTTSDTPVTVTLADTVSSAAIYYTTDGTTPTTSSTLYGGPFSLANSATITAIAALPGAVPSAPVSASFVVNTTPPTTTATVNGTLGLGGWYTGAVTVSLSATDPLGPSYLFATYFTLDGATQTTYSLPIGITSDGTHSLIYYSVNTGGNAEAPHSLTISIDSTPPVTTESGATSGATNYGPVTISLSATDNLSGVASTYYTVDSGAQTTYSVPFAVSTAGSHTITYWSVDKAGNVETTHTLTFTISLLPVVASFTPTSGPVGSTVVITGANFTGATYVRFNGASTSFTVNSATQITATVPSKGSTGTISVTTKLGTGTSSGVFTYVIPPTITSFTPTSGIAGSKVTITGTNFTGATYVRFNGASTSFTVVSATKITATVPSLGSSGSISVTTPSGTATSSATFTYLYLPTITSFTPTSGKAGTSVVITGANFTGATFVRFNGASTSFTVNSSTQITAKAPTKGSTGPISVTTNVGTGTSTGTFTY